MEPTGRQPGAQQLQICVICETHTSEKLTKVSDVGLEVLRTSCEIRHRYNLLEFLSSEPAEVLVHGSCRKSFTRSSELKKIELQLEYPTEARSSLCKWPFLWKTVCFFVCMSCIK